MIRLWLSRDQSIPIREQLSTQLLLGIVSKRIMPGERLPSVRELARRLHIHANTVSAAYRDLATRGWVAERRGSGVYVRDVGLPAPREGIEGFVRTWIEAGIAQGFAVEAMQATFARIAQEPTAQKLLVVDPDEHLARILAAEITDRLGSFVACAGFENAAQPLTTEICVLALPAHVPRVIRELKPASHRTIILRSMEDLLVGHRRPSPSALIAVISRSESIRRWSSTLLSALGFPPVAVLLRCPDEPHWKRGLSSCNIVAADVEAINELPINIKGIELRIVSPSFLDELGAL